MLLALKYQTLQLITSHIQIQLMHINRIWFLNIGYIVIVKGLTMTYIPYSNLADFDYIQRHIQSDIQVLNFPLSDFKGLSPIKFFY